MWQKALPCTDSHHLLFLLSRCKNNRLFSALTSAIASKVEHIVSISRPVVLDVCFESMMSHEDRLRFFRPISFDERDSDVFLKPEQANLLESDIAKPIPTTPRSGISLDDSDNQSCVRPKDEASQEGCEQLLNAGSDAQRKELKGLGSSHDIIRSPFASECPVHPNCESAITVVANDASADFTKSEESLASKIQQEHEILGHATPFVGSMEEREETSEGVHPSDVSESTFDERFPSLTNLPFPSLTNLEHRGSAPISTSSSCSLTCSAGAATFTSITTANSSMSRRDSELVKPVPRRVPKSFVSEASQTQEETVDNTRTQPTKKHIQLNSIASCELASRSSSEGHEKVFADRKLSEKTGHPFRTLVSSSRERSGTEPWNVRKKNTLSSSSSSPTDADEKTSFGRRGSFGREASNGSMRASGPLGVLRLKKAVSRAIDDDDSNPWFQERSSQSVSQDISDDDRGLRPLQHTASLGAKAEKPKKIRFRKIGRQLFSKDKDGKGTAPLERHDLTTSSSYDSLTPVSLTQDATRFSHDVVPESRKDSTSLEKDVRKALLSKQPLEHVLEKVLALYERPSEDLPNLFYRYLSTNGAVERGIQLLLCNDVIGDGEASWTESASYRTHCELLLHAYVTGPNRLRKAVLNHAKARAQLLTFLTKESKDMKTGSEAYLFKVHSLAKILNGILMDSASDVTDFMGGNPGFLCSFVKYHISVAEVVDFVSQLCAANALSDNAGDELRYGAPNAAGIMLLVKEGICDLLVCLFEDTCEKTVAIGDDARWQLQVMSTRCLLELSKRSVVAPKFSKNNCSYSSKHIKSLNDALEGISSFENVNRVYRLLRAGLGCIHSTTGSGSSQVTVGKTNAGVCALSFVTELLDLVSLAGDSKSVVTRRTVGTASTKALEDLMVAQIAPLCRLLADRNCAGTHGRLRVEIVKSFRSLFGSKWEESRMALVESDVPECLLKAVGANKLCSILHGCVVECIATSLRREESGVLHRAWLSAIEKVGMMDEMVEILGRKCEGGDDREGLWSTYGSTVVDIGFVICMFSQNLRRGEFRGLFESEERYQIFIGKIEPGLGKVEEGRRGACGGPKPEGTVVSVLANADALAAKINDVDAV